MLYRKNLYSWEQGARAVVGLGVALYAAVAFPGGLGLGAYATIATGVFLAATGVVGWCPACATVGRRLKSREEPHV
jgi:Protein of unknown function (DUF2892)